MASDRGTTFTIQELLDSGAIVAHKDGNYGSKYPRKEEFGTDGVPFLTAKSIQNGFIDIDGAPRLGDARADELTFGFVEPDDVLLSHNATIGRVAIVPPIEGRLLVGTSLTYFRLDPSRVIPRYFAAYLAGTDFQNQLTAVMSHSTRNQVPITTQRLLRVSVPPISKQCAIAHILGTLDDKIELNRRRNETLEGMARALFKDWFIDFGPVRAKMEGREPYLDPETWALFPDRLDEEGRPEGWAPGRVGDVLKLVYGKSLPAKKRSPGDVPVYGSGGLTGWHDEPLVTEPTVIVGRKGTIGSLNWESRPCFPIDTVFYVNAIAPLEYCYRLLQSLPLATMNTDAAVPGLNRENVYRLEVARPSADSMTAFCRFADGLRSRANALDRENETLAQLRDTLLPKLISGKLRIPDPERFLAEHVAAESGPAKTKAA